METKNFSRLGWSGLVLEKKPARNKDFVGDEKGNDGWISKYFIRNSGYRYNRSFVRSFSHSISKLNNALINFPPNPSHQSLSFSIFGA